MQSLDPTGTYSNTAVLAALTARTGIRRVSFRYDRLDQNNVYIEPLTAVAASGNSVSNDSLADIKRTAKFSLIDTGSINFLKDRIKPWCRLTMADGGYVEWPQGVFVLSTPTRVYNAGYVTRAVDAFDQLLVLQQDAIAARYNVAAGTNYGTAILAILAGYTFASSVTPTTLTVPAILEWEPGTTVLQILNDLLAAINYESSFFDENGRFVARPYVLPAGRAIDYFYNSDSSSVITGTTEQTLDIYNTPNRFVGVKSDPDQPALVSVVVNANPASPTSTVSRGRTITSVTSEVDVADQTTLDAKVARLAFEASQVYETVKLNTLLMPMHGNGDILNVNVPGLTVGAKYSEQSWSMPLEAGGIMSHSIRRVVSV